MDDLAERLLNIDHNWHEAACHEAADEIRSLRAQVEHERAGIVALLRTKAGVYAAAQFGVCAALLLDQADAIERHEDKEPRA